jgi:uncharacterized protein (TIGR02284 family)
MDKDIQSILNELIETSKDGEKGFRRSAEEIQDASLKAIFLEGAERCRMAARDLQEQVRALGGNPETGGSMMGAIHRGWVDAKSAVTGRDSKAILEEVERGEDYAKARYAAALKANLPPGLRDLVQRQYEGVLKNHDRVKALRNEQRAAR